MNNLITEKKFCLKVRAIIHDGDNLLVVRIKGQNFCFLPGGTHEIGETLANTLVREIKEEIGLSAEVKEYLGVVENSWSEDNSHIYEINHVFEAVIPELNTKTNPPSLENHLEFFWIKPEDFEKQRLLPVMIQPLVVNWLEGDKKIWKECNLE